MHMLHLIDIQLRSLNIIVLHCSWASEYSVMHMQLDINSACQCSNQQSGSNQYTLSLVVRYLTFITHAYNDAYTHHPLNCFSILTVWHFNIFILLFFSVVIKKSQLCLYIYQSAQFSTPIYLMLDIMQPTAAWVVLTSILHVEIEIIPNYTRVHYSR